MCVKISKGAVRSFYVACGENKLNVSYSKMPDMLITKNTIKWLLFDDCHTYLIFLSYFLFMTLFTSDFKG